MLDLSITPAVFGVRPPVTKPSPEFLTAITEEGMRALISEHYESIKTSDIQHLFPVEDAQKLAEASKHAADFFIQICGGPAYFNNSRGAPRMVGRHAPFAITSSARVTWLKLYIPILEKLDMNENLVQGFWNYLDIFSNWMVNTPQR